MSDPRRLRERVLALTRYGQQEFGPHWNPEEVVPTPDGQWLKRADVLALLVEAVAPQPEPTKKRYTFDDFCEGCITTRWCEYRGGCLAERLPPSPVVDPPLAPPTTICEDCGGVPEDGTDYCNSCKGNRYDEVERDLSRRDRQP